MGIGTHLIGHAAGLLAPIAFRGKARLLHSLCPHRGECDARIFGYNVSLYLEDYIQRSIFLRTFEPQETQLVASYLRRGMTFVDAGANIGYFSLLAASIVGSEGIVYAFEPSPIEVCRLKANVSRNAIDRIIVVESGLGSRPGLIELFVPITFENRSPTMVPHDGQGQAVPVAVTTLDAFCAERGIERIDLLKMDVEGFESDIVRGSDSLLKNRRIKGILCEFNQTWLVANGTSGDELYDLIRSYGYRERGTHYERDTGLQNLMFEIEVT